METFRFKKLEIYKLAREFCNITYKLVKEKFPSNERFGLSSQLLRAATSIVLNIAEGSAKFSDPDFRRFLLNALGSCNEVVAILDLSLDQKYINQEEYQLLINKLSLLTNKLGALIKKIHRDIQK
jgi:four helix bundle protein